MVRGKSPAPRKNASTKPIRREMARRVRWMRNAWGVTLRKRDIRVAQRPDAHFGNAGDAVHPSLHNTFGEIIPSSRDQSTPHSKKNPHPRYRRLSMFVGEGSASILRSRFKPRPDFPTRDHELFLQMGEAKLVVAHELGHAVGIGVRKQRRQMYIGNFLASLSEIEYIKSHMPNLFSRFINCSVGGRDQTYVNIFEPYEHGFFAIIQELMIRVPKSSDRRKAIRRILNSNPSGTKQLKAAIARELGRH